MYLHEAVKKAKESGRGFTRQIEIQSISYIPTNTIYGIIMIINNQLTPRWQPSEDDLTADDWEITTCATTNQLQVDLGVDQK